MCAKLSRTPSSHPKGACRMKHLEQMPESKKLRLLFWTDSEDPPRIWLISFGAQELRFINKVGGLKNRKWKTNSSETLWSIRETTPKSSWHPAGGEGESPANDLGSNWVFKLTL